MSNMTPEQKIALAQQEYYAKQSRLEAEYCRKAEQARLIGLQMAAQARLNKKGK